MLRSLGRHEFKCASPYVGSFAEQSLVFPISKSPHRPQNPSVLHNVKADQGIHLTPLLFALARVAMEDQITSDELETISACSTKSAQHHLQKNVDKLSQFELWSTLALAISFTCGRLDSGRCMHQSLWQCIMRRGPVSCLARCVLKQMCEEQELCGGGAFAL